MSIERIYKTITKQQFATAYGFRSVKGITKRIRKKLHTLNDEQVLLLGDWTNHGNLLPEQTEVLVFLMGKPQEPDILFKEKRT